MSTPVQLTTHVQTAGAHVGVIGARDVLQAAFERGEQITLEGAKFGGERVYLGYTHQVYGDYGITVETIGLDQVIGEVEAFPGVEIAVFLVDLDRLELAPTLAEIERKARQRSLDRVMRMQARADEEERRLTRHAD